MLGALDTWGETAGSTRYDLTASGPGRLRLVEAVIPTLSPETDASGEPTPEGG